MSFIDRFGGVPELHTRRLTLREIRLDDAPQLLEWLSDREVTRYLPWNGPDTLAEAEQRCRGQREWFRTSWCIPWAIARMEDDRLIGRIRYYAFSGQDKKIGEIGYDLSRAEWNKGIMTEALHAVVKFGFEGLELHRIQLTSAPANVASIRVAAKVGFVEEGLQRESAWHEIKHLWYDLKMFALLRRAYRPAAKESA